MAVRSSLGDSRKPSTYSARALVLPEFDHGRGLFLADVGRMQAHQAAGARRQKEHVAAAQQRLGAVGVENGARVHLGGQAEADARGNVGLDEAGDDVHAGPLRGQDEVNAHGARHLRQARDGLFNVGAVEHHQVGELVDDDDDVGQRLFLLDRRRRAKAWSPRRACCTGRCCARCARPAA